MSVENDRSKRVRVRPGYRFGGADGQRFEIVKPLGVGSQAAVYRVLDTRLQREVAAKIVKESLGLEAVDLFRKRFERELRLTAKFQSPHIVQIFDCGELDNGAPYVIIELMEHGGLDHVLKGSMRQRRYLPVRHVLYWARGIALGLLALHRVGVVHRDIKPANVLVAADGTPKICDLGIAKELEGTRLTEVGITMGTVGFMAPEHIRGMPGPQSDIFSLGVSIYLLLMARIPPQKKINGYMVGLIEPQAWRHVPRELLGFLHRCTDQELGRRFQSCEELLEALAALQVVEIPGRPVVADEDLPPLPTDNFFRPESSATVDLPGATLPLPSELIDLQPATSPLSTTPSSVSDPHSATRPLRAEREGIPPTAPLPSPEGIAQAREEDDSALIKKPTWNLSVSHDEPEPPSTGDSSLSPFKQGGKWSLDGDGAPRRGGRTLTLDLEPTGGTPHVESDAAPALPALPEPEPLPVRPSSAAVEALGVSSSTAAVPTARSSGSLMFTGSGSSDSAVRLRRSLADPDTRIVPGWGHDLASLRGLDPEAIELYEALPAEPTRLGALRAGRKELQAPLQALIEAGWARVTSAAAEAGWEAAPPPTSGLGRLGRRLHLGLAWLLLGLAAAGLLLLRVPPPVVARGVPAAWARVAVTDAESLQPLAGSWAGVGEVVARTDADGRAELYAPDPFEALTVGRAGSVLRSVPLRRSLAIELEPSAVALDADADRIVAQLELGVDGADGLRIYSGALPVQTRPIGSAELELSSASGVSELLCVAVGGGVSRGAVYSPVQERTARVVISAGEVEELVFRAPVWPGDASPAVLVELPTRRGERAAWIVYATGSVAEDGCGARCVRPPVDDARVRYVATFSGTPERRAELHVPLARALDSGVPLPPFLPALLARFEVELDGRVPRGEVRWAAPALPRLHQRLVLRDGTAGPALWSIELAPDASAFRFPRLPAELRRCLQAARGTPVLELVVSQTEGEIVRVQRELFPLR